MPYFDESNPALNVILAFGEVESVHLLSIVLEGFGYGVLICRNLAEIHHALENNHLSAAIIHLGLPDAQAICNTIGHNNLPLLALAEDDQDDRPDCLKGCQMADWELDDAGPDQILKKLANLVHRR